MRPSTEQWRQLHGMSREIYGDALKIWDHHDQPETREEASELLRMLHGIEPEEETMEETRVCAECGEEKPITEFRKWGRGRKKECEDCLSGEGEETQSTGDAPEVVQATDGLGQPFSINIHNPNPGEGIPSAMKRALDQIRPVEEEHWCLAELRDPRVSTVRQAREIFEAAGADLTLEDTADALRKIADLDLA